jgi:hypothetical protein
MLYTTLDDERLDLTKLSSEERAYFERCYRAFRDGMSWDEFGNLVTGGENPLIRATGGWVTRDVWDHPLFRAISDLEDRLGILQEEIDPEPGDEVDRDPVAGEWLSIAETG